MQAPHVIAWSFENFPTSSTILQGNFKVWYVSDTLSNKTQARMADLTKGEKVEGVITNVSTEQKLQVSFSLNKYRLEVTWTMKDGQNNCSHDCPVNILSEILGLCCSNRASNPPRMSVALTECIH